VARKKPRNYRGRLPYVNLEASGAAFWVKDSSHRNYLNFTISSQGSDALLDPRAIPFIGNNFRTQNKRFDNAALMRHTAGSFATCKPAFWCQKDED
jgi:hypothetical protein